MPSTASRPCFMFVLGLAPQKIGGIETFLRYLARALDQKGWNTVLCFDGPISDQFRDYIAAPFVILESVDHQGELGFACAGTLWTMLRKHKPQSFMYAFHGVMRCFPWLAKLAGCRKIIFNDHSSRPVGYVPGPISLPKRIIGRILTAPLTSVCSVANFTRRTGNALGVTSVPNEVVSNGVEIRPIEPGLRASFREAHGVGPEEFLITQVCWMVPVKGVHVMLKAAKQVLSAHAGARFLFVGDGPKLQEYRDLAAATGISQSVTFTGLVKNPTAMGVFDASDLYCQPSLWQEACPLAVLEAMSFKLPVVASDTGGLPELVAQGRSGILVPAGDSDALATALNRLIADQPLRTAMGEAGYQTVLEDHRIDDVAARYVALLA